MKALVEKMLTLFSAFLPAAQSRLVLAFSLRLLLLFFSFFYRSHASRVATRELVLYVYALRSRSSCSFSLAAPTEAFLTLKSRLARSVLTKATNEKRRGC